MRLQEWRLGRPWATNVALCLFGLGLFLLTRQYVWEYGGEGQFVLGGSGCSGWSVWLYVAAMIVVLTQPTNKATMWIVIGFAVVSRLAIVFADPFSSSDIYRYVWDGVVQHAGVNPYHYVPGDTALAWLREPNSEVFDNINRRDYARTIYPPAAQMVYWLVTWISPTVTMMKAAMVGFECIACAAMVGLLRMMGRPREQVLLYAWCPLAVWEIGGAGHVDAVVIAFVALALLARARRNDWLTGLFLGLAVMTKFYPLVLFPALWRRGDWRMPAVMVAVAAVVYAVYSSVGMLVFGFLGGYTEEEGMATGARYFLLQWAQSVRGMHGLTMRGYMVFCVLVFAGLTVWAWRKATVEGPVRAGVTPEFLRVAMVFAIALMLLFSPHYPWYVVWLIPFLALVPNLPLLVYVLGFFYLFTTELAEPGPKMFLLNEYLYGATLVGFVMHLVLKRWPVHRWMHPEYVREG